MSNIVKLFFNHYRSLTAIASFLFIAVLVLAAGQGNLLGRTAVFAAIRDNIAPGDQGRKFLPAISKKIEVQRPIVGAVNGVAFIVVDGKNGAERIDLRTTRPVFKAFGMTSDGGKLLIFSLGSRGSLG